MANEGYVRYDYAWKTPGWTVQNPTFTLLASDGFSDPGFPPDVIMVTITGSWLELDSGRSLEGFLEIRSDQILTYVTTGQEVMPGVKDIRFRPEGVNFMLPATDNVKLQPEGWQYQARLTVEGITREFNFSLPSTPNPVPISTLIAAAP